MPISDWMKPIEQRLSEEHLAAYAANIRLEAVRIWRELTGPLSGALSIADLYTVFFLNFLDKELYLTSNKKRARFIPKGTSAGALYAVAGYAGLINPQRIIDIDKNDLEIVPTKSGFADASLYKMGAQLEQGIGMALAGKYSEEHYPVVVFLSDGSLQLGVDHPAKFAATMQLNNLTLVIDVNGLQSSYRIEQVDHTLGTDDQGKLSTQQRIWKSYGWRVIEIDGHNLVEIQEAYEQIGYGDKPLIILARTIKGKGVPFMENSVNYNHKLQNDAEYERLRYVLQKQVENFAGKGYSIEYVSDFDDSESTIDSQGFTIPSLAPMKGMSLEDYLMRWLEIFIEINPCRVMIINTDNPYPFPKNTPVYSPHQPAPYVFAGVNERFALNLAVGLCNEEFAPIYMGPAAHMPITSEDWKMLSLDRDNVLMVSRYAGSALSHWGAAHLSYEDIELFKTPNSLVLQPAHPYDLHLILENCYNGQNSPVYLRHQTTESININVTLFNTIDKRKKIFTDGLYEIGDFVSPKSNPVFVSIIASGKIVAEALKAAKQLSNQGITCNVLNVLNLSKINSKILNQYTNDTSLIITAIDAKPESLSSLIYESLSSGRDRLITLGVRDGGDFSGENEILRKNKLDSSGIFETMMKASKNVVKDESD